MVNIAISLVGSNGDTIELTNEFSDYILTTGVAGFGVPPTQVRIQESAGDGGTWRNTKRGIREIDLPIVISGTDRQDLETKLGRLADLLQDISGPTKIVASYSDGTAYELLAHYVAGADATYGEDANSRFVRWVITLQAPQPFWESVTPTNFALSASTGRGLLPNLSKLKLTSAFGFGEVTITNPGSVVTFPLWSLKGPADSVVIERDGVGFTYEAPIALGETITINTQLGTVVDQNGVNKYGNLGPAPKLFSLNRGSQTITVNAPGAGAATMISGNFKPRREVIY
jgi:hypothetical protein